jgi:hypothetical protein
MNQNTNILEEASIYHKTRSAMHLILHLHKVQRTFGLQIHNEICPFDGYFFSLSASHLNWRIGEESFSVMLLNTPETVAAIEFLSDKVAKEYGWSRRWFPGFNNHVNASHLWHAILPAGCDRN